MLQALIVTLREGVEAALIVGITLAYLSKIGRPELRRVVYTALGAAFVCSIGVAVVLYRTQFNQDIFEGWVMLVAAFFVITMIWFMSRAAKRLKGEIEGKVGGLANGGRIFGLFLFVFLMVLREGAETVLILAAVEFNSTQLLSFMGTLIGVLLAVIFGVMFVKGSIRINLQRFFRVTTVILIFVAAQLLVSGLHELSENGVLKSSREEMALIGPIVRNDLFFFVTILALAALMILFDQRRRQDDGTRPPGSKDSRALQRKATLHWVLVQVVSIRAVLGQAPRGGESRSVRSRDSGVSPKFARRLPCTRDRRAATLRAHRFQRAAYKGGEPGLGGGNKAAEADDCFASRHRGPS